MRKVGEVLPKKAEYFETGKKLDTCQDLLLTVGTAYEIEDARLTDKVTLEIFESMLVSNHQDFYKKIKPISLAK